MDTRKIELIGYTGPHHDPREPLNIGQMRHDIAASRAAMDDTLEELNARLNPEYLKEQVIHMIQEHTHNVKEGLSRATECTGQTIRKHPLTSLAIGAGVAWLILDRENSPLHSARADHAREKARKHADRAYEEADRLYRQAREAAGEQADELRRRADALREQARSRLSEHADQVHERLESAADRARQAVQDAKSRIQQQGQEMAERAEAAGDKVCQAVQEGGHKVRKEVESKPFWYGAGALGLGLLLGWLMPGDKKR